MNAPIFILGYGSLIWDLDDLAPKVRGPWLLRDGPAFPLEFSRVSPKRKRSLVVVIDPDHGDDCPTHAIASRRAEVAAARTDLAARERTEEHFIGWVDLARDDGFSRNEGIAGRVAAWCRARGAAGAVWTDLDGNFEAETGQPFAIAPALDYLRGLEGESAAAAREYINGAPQETNTPLRRALTAQEWWDRAG